MTADDAKWSFKRYQCAGAKQLWARVRQVDAVDPLSVRVHLKEPWPDFMTAYGTAATAAWIVLPRTYVEQVEADGFKQRPIGKAVLPRSPVCTDRRSRHRPGG